MTASSVEPPSFSDISESENFKYLVNNVPNQIFTTISASLSIFGTLIIIMTFIAWKDARSTSRRILIYISISDFFVAAGNLYGVWFDSNQELQCKVQSFISTCALLCSYFWTTFLAVFMYIVVAKKSPATAKKALRVFFLFGWGIPIIVTSIALSKDVLGNNGNIASAGWCWIKRSNQHRILWMWITKIAWEISAYILISIFYGFLKYHIQKEVHVHHQQFRTLKAMEDALKAERRLTFVPVVFILLRIWGTIRAIGFLVYPSKANVQVLLFLQSIGDNGQGFANFVLFCLLTEKFQLQIKEIVDKCLKRGTAQLGYEVSTTPVIYTSDPKQSHVQERLICSEKTPLLVGDVHC